MLKWILLPLLLGIAILIVYTTIYLGAFKAVEMNVTNTPEQWLLYKEHRGAYHLISPLLDEVEKIARSNNLPCPKTFGLFLDDPQTVDEDRLRSEVGCLLNGKPETVPEGLLLKEWPSGRFLHLEFKGSPSIGPFKVYPKAQEWFQNQRKSFPKESIEVYFVSPQGEVTTDYYFQISEMAY